MASISKVKWLTFQGHMTSVALAGLELVYRTNINLGKIWFSSKEIKHQTLLIFLSPPHTNRHTQIQIKHTEIKKLLLRRFFTAGGNRRRLERSIQRWNTFTLHCIYVGIHLDSTTFTLEYIYTPLPSIDNWASRKTLVHWDIHMVNIVNALLCFQQKICTLQYIAAL